MWAQSGHRRSPWDQRHYAPVIATTLPTTALPTAGCAVWRSPLAWGLTVMFGMTALVTYALFAWLPVLLIDAGGSERLGRKHDRPVRSPLGFAGTLVAPSICARFP